LRQIRTMLIDTLAKDGLERVDAADVPFDPAVHDAVAHAEAQEAAEDGAEPGPRVDEVMRSGYRWRGRTLRPAMVRVRG
jgi:molecular chaperone GrpE